MLDSKRHFKTAFKQRCMSLLSKPLEEANLMDKYIILASLVRDELNKKWSNTNNYYLKKKTRQIYYFSLEFLIGKSLERNLQYLGKVNFCREGLTELGISLDDLIECEPEAGLGNGGLGRLAACFLDSLATLGYPGHGCGIRYKYGLFKQMIVDGHQVELPDNWLRQNNPWEIKKPDKAVIVRFNGRVTTEIDDLENVRFVHRDYLPVLAVPYDMPIIGYNNNTVNTLRLWSAETIDEALDFASFSRGDYTNAFSGRYSVETISEVLYPDDSNYSNRLLRLKQQYFFVSAGIQSIVRRFRRKQSDLNLLPDLVGIHINDTHPALAIPELMRILIDEEGFGWEKAWNITTRIVAYTNHTIMPEALETWPVDAFQDILPRIYMIVEEINRRFCLELLERYPNDDHRIRDMAIIADGMVKMANLAVVGSHSVNGVAAIHSELLKHVVMKNLYDFYPAKFNNKTNGITHRRWLLKANPGLSSLITEAIGDSWIKNPIELRFLSKYKDDPSMHQKLIAIKRANKERLAAYIEKHNNIQIDPDSIFDVQVKRIHAYKRQLLNAIHIQYLYNRLVENPALDVLPRTFIFSGKAAPSYYYAKNIIKYINELANTVNNDERVNQKLRVVFLENYNVGLAEIIFPASDVSEQISTASKEASGTGNMKFMMNGAITVGTNDGANIEIRELVGDENFILFGLNVEEILTYYNNGGYNANEICQNNPYLNRLVQQIIHAEIFPNIPFETTSAISRSLLDFNDEFFVLKDFASYAQAHEKIDGLYRQKSVWSDMSLMNIAMSGSFSSDNTINQYASEIWRLEKCYP